MEENKDFPNLLQALYLLAALIITEWLIYCGLAGISVAVRSGMHGVNAVVSVLASGIIFALLMSYKNLTFARFFNAGTSSSSALLIWTSIPIVFVGVGLAILIQDLMALVLWLMPMTQSQYDGFAEFGKGGVVTLLAVCVVAPVIEEMLFRGVFLRSFLHQYGGKEAIIFSSLLFAIAHMNVYQAAAALVIGLLLGWLFARTRSLWPCIVGHASYNLGCLLIPTGSGAAQGGNSVAASTASALPSFSMHMIAILLVVIGGVMLWKLIGVKHSG